MEPVVYLTARCEQVRAVGRLDSSMGLWVNTSVSDFLSYFLWVYLGVSMGSEYFTPPPLPLSFNAKGQSLNLEPSFYRQTTSGANLAPVLFVFCR